MSMPFLILALVIPGSFGGGDIKLTAVCGFVLGPLAIMKACFFALFFSGAWGVFLIIFQGMKKDRFLPFSPFLTAGMIIVHISDYLG